MHAVRRVVRGVPAGIIARRPAPPGRIVPPQLTAFAQQARVQPPPAPQAQPPLVHQRRKQDLRAHCDARQYASAALKWSMIGAFLRPSATGPLMAVSTFAPPPAAAAVSAPAELVQHWIGGPPASGAGARLPLFNPATGAVARQGGVGGEGGVRAAVAGAQAPGHSRAENPP